MAVFIFNFPRDKNNFDRFDDFDEIFAPLTESSTNILHYRPLQALLLILMASTKECRPMHLPKSAGQSGQHLPNATKLCRHLIALIQ